MPRITVRNLCCSPNLVHNKEITIEKGIVTNISDYHGSNFDYENLAPALVDIHINGGEKYHFTATPTEEALIDIELSAQKNGVGYVLPAVITSSLETVFQAIESVKKYKKANPETGILGLHLEGPFISAKKRGAHLEKYILKPSDELLLQMIKEGEDVLKMITIAPEHFSNNQISMLLEAGLNVSLGHSDCTFERAQEAFGLGVKLVTHLFNAMSPFGHRSPGLAGAALFNENVYTPIIPDNVHVSYKAVQLAMKLKKDKLFFISDALFQNGVKQEFKWQEFDAKLVNDMYVNNEGNLAGANISMTDCVENAVNNLELNIWQAITKCSYTPARALNLPVGTIDIGTKAKFINFQNGLKIQYIQYV